MNVNDYLRFLEEAGCNKFKCGDSYFVEYKKFFLESIPPHKSVSLSKTQLLKLFLKGFAVIRLTASGNQTHIVYEYICNNKSFDLSTLHSKARNQTRRGLENCLIRELAVDELRDIGTRINKSVFKRQGRIGSKRFIDEQSWGKYLDTIKRFPEIKCYGAFYNSTLCAYVFIIPVENYCYIYHPMSDNEYLSYYPLNALIYSVTKEIMNNPDISFISYGLESATTLEGLERFKERMGYTKRELHRQVIINPIIIPFVKAKLVFKLLKYLQQKIKSHFLDNVIKFYEAYIIS